MPRTDRVWDEIANPLIATYRVSERCGRPVAAVCARPEVLGVFIFRRAQNGWGERIRTSDWLIQNQLPYHLATPQRAGGSLPEGRLTNRPGTPRREFSTGLAPTTRVYTQSLMDLPELLRSQAKRYRCAVCNTNMADCGIKVITQQGNRALVRVTCASCNDENLLQIIFQADGELIENAPQRVPTISEGIPSMSEPISSDELLDLRDLLAAHQGGFRELLERR